jgi:hypothetical protein
VEEGVLVEDEDPYAELPTVAAAEVAVPVEHQGEPLGTLFCRFVTQRWVSVVRAPIF